MKQRNNSKQSGRSQPIVRWLMDGKRLWVAAVMIVVLLLSAALLYSWMNRSILDSSVVSKADFSVYAPSEPPVGYQLQPEQTSLSGSILTYSFQGDGADKTITVTVQSRPAEFDVSEMTKGGSVTSTVTSNGTLYDLSFGAASQYLLDTGDALIYLKSAGQIDTTTIHSLADSLNKIN